MTQSQCPNSGNPERVERLPKGVAHALSCLRHLCSRPRDNLERWNRYLARGIAWIEMTLSPEVVVLGTIARAAGETLCLEPVRRLVAEQTWSRAGGPRIVAGELGDELPDRAALAVAEIAAEQAVKAG